MLELFGKRFFYKGNRALLEKEAVAVVGTRRPGPYTKRLCLELAGGLAKRGVVVISGAAMGVDALAHRGAGAKNTIAVLPCGLNHIYPKVNAALIEEIAKNGLLLSPFDMDFKATRWSFVTRNEWVVRLAKELFIVEADINSGSLTSARYAKKHGKDIYVPPHRLGESLGTVKLVKEALASPIWDLDEYLGRFKVKDKEDDPVIKYLKSSPFYEEALERLGQRLYELELEGSVDIIDGRVVYKGEI